MMTVPSIEYIIVLAMFTSKFRLKGKKFFSIS